MPSYILTKCSCRIKKREEVIRKMSPTAVTESLIKRAGWKLGIPERDVYKATSECENSKSTKLCFSVLCLVSSDHVAQKLKAEMGIMEEKHFRPKT